MNVKQLKELIKDVPDDYMVQVNVDVENEDLPDVLTQLLYANEIKRSGKAIVISSDLYRNITIDL